MAGLPLLKLSSLLIKTISKPLGTRLKFEASRFPTFYAASVKIGQTSHYLQSRVNVLASGYKFLGVKPLPVDEAMEVGVSYLADGIIIFLGATIIIIEYSRNEAKNKIKAEKAAASEAENNANLEARFTVIEQKINDILVSLPTMQQAQFIATRADRLTLVKEEAAAAAAQITDGHVPSVETNETSPSDDSLSMDSNGDNQLTKG